MHKIAIIDADLVANRKKHRFPNLACMKISSWHKAHGDDVELKLDYEDLDKYDKVFISKVFDEVYGKKVEVSEDVLNMNNVEYGGTGFFYDKAPGLPDDIEHSKPDYSLYKEWVENEIDNGGKRKSFEYYLDFSIGFTTRGCIRGCTFCVNRNYKKSSVHSSLEEFLDEDRKFICLLDDNVLACSGWKSIFDELIAIGKPVQYKQGFDERLLTREKVDYVFNRLNWRGDWFFAFDNIKDRDVIEEKLQLILNGTKAKRNKKFYTFCAFNHDDPGAYDDGFWLKDIEDLFERIAILMRYKCLPYIMRYKDYDKSPHRGMYITLARWCNQPSFFKKKSFREFCEANQAAAKPNEICATMRYMTEFEEKYPEIAEMYFDLKFSEVFKDRLN